MQPCSLGVLGGDARQLYLAHAAAADGFSVALSALEQLPESPFPACSPRQLLDSCARILLPMPISWDGETLNAPFARRAVPLGTLRFSPETRAFGGLLGTLPTRFPALQAVEEYAHFEDLLTGNAALTAEGALAAAIRETPGSLAGARCLVLGFGRIGRALCGLLPALHAQVDCFARDPSVHPEIAALGCRPLGLGAVHAPYEVVFNTVPAPVFGESEMQSLPSHAVLLELASAPGGIDPQAARRHSLRLVSLPGLPGTTAPLAAGTLLWRCISARL